MAALPRAGLSLPPPPPHNLLKHLYKSPKGCSLFMLYTLHFATLIIYIRADPPSPPLPKYLLAVSRQVRNVPVPSKQGGEELRGGQEGRKAEERKRVVCLPEAKPVRDP